MNNRERCDKENELELLRSQRETIDETIVKLETEIKDANENSGRPTLGEVLDDVCKEGANLDTMYSNIYCGKPAGTISGLKLINYYLEEKDTHLHAAVSGVVPENPGFLPDTIVYSSTWYITETLADHLNITTEQLKGFFKLFHDNPSYFGFRWKFIKRGKWFTLFKVPEWILEPDPDLNK